MSLPRLVVAAPASGHGKTTVATGLMAALTRAGHAVSGHKVGPDYIDPGYHALATGRPGRNLDPHLVGEDRLVPLLLHGARGADIAMVEGVMGLYDGQLGGDGFASTAHVAAVTGTPVVLVVDISHASRSIAAVIHGLRTWGEADVRGVILNKAGSSRHAEEVVAAIGDRLPVLGVLHRDDGIEAPSRHLGLIPAAERADAARALDRLATQVAERVDLEAVVRLARTAPDLPAGSWDPAEALAACHRLSHPLDTRGNESTVPVTGGDSGARARPVVAVAGGRAFTFRYAETTELLTAAGADVAELDPLSDDQLPDGTSALYLGGGFPEMHAAELAANTALRDRIREAVAAGLPTVAECAGLLYLCRTVRGAEGPAAAMVGALDLDAVMAPKLTLAYRTATAPTDNLLARRGERVTGHEFHRTTLVAEPDPAGMAPAWLLPDPAGVATESLHASYLHVHWAGYPQLARRLVAAARTQSGDPPGPGAGRPSHQGSRNGPDLRHHGDREVAEGLLDLAVNVYVGQRPPWLDKALATSLDDLARYPDPTEAEAAVAGRHGREPADVLATAGAAEAFTLLARLHGWRRPTVVHPQFTEPDVALIEAGHRPHHVILRVDHGFRLDPDQVPADADLVVVGNPTNPTGVRHTAATLRSLARPGRLLVVDEAFLDDGAESLADERIPGVLVIRSLTKLWSIPGIRAGYLLAEPEVVAALRRRQTPWSVSTPAAAALTACSSPAAIAEGRSRSDRLAAWRDHLTVGLHRLGVGYVPSTAPFVLARLGEGVRDALRDAGIAVRRGDTFPGLDPSWARIAARPETDTDTLMTALSRCC